MQDRHPSGHRPGVSRGAAWTIAFWLLLAGAAGALMLVAVATAAPALYGRADELPGAFTGGAAIIIGALVLLLARRSPLGRVLARLVAVTARELDRGPRLTAIIDESLLGPDVVDLDESVAPVTRDYD